MSSIDPKRGRTEQDKRSVVSIEIEDVDLWLFGTVDQAAGLARVPGVEVFAAGRLRAAG
jgi:hypothetical protein